MLTDVYNKIPINSEKKDFFKISIDENFNSIDVLFNWKDKMDIEVLFLIIKSYVLNKEYLIKNIYIVATNENLKKNNINPNFFRHLNIKKLEKINIFEFKLFYEEMFENDWEYYLNNFDLYGLTIIFAKESQIWKNKNFYPKYPFEENFKNNFIVENMYIKKIKNLKKENYILKQKILKYSMYIKKNNK
jgi:hypothetical protein